jgi:HlyD family secretion protein
MLNRSESSELKALRLITEQELLSPVDRWTSLSGMVLAGAVGVAILLSTLLKYNVTIQAVAVARPAGELRLVQSEQEGTIQKTVAKPNQRVRRGEAIAYLDTAPLQIKQRQIQDSIKRDESQHRQLQIQVQIVEPQIASEATVQAANLEAADADLALAMEEMQRYQQLAAQGVVSQLQYRQKQTAYKIAIAQQKRAAAANPSEGAIAAQGAPTLANLQRQQAELQQQQAQIESQIRQNREALKAIEIDMQKSVLRATEDGLLTHFNLRNPSQVIHSGDTVAQIVPDHAPIVFKAAVATSDINHVRVGQTVYLRIDACPYPEFGVLKGTVREVAPDTLPPSESPETDARSSSQIEVMIQPEKIALTRGEQQCPIQNGMTSRADIISNQESIMQFILRQARLMADF